MALGRLRIALDLDRRHPLGFLSRCTAICTAIDESKTLFPAPTPAIPLVLAQLEDATAAQQLLARDRGAGPARDAAFGIVVTSMESLRMMVQVLCDQSPIGEARTLIAAASMRPILVGVRHKDILGLKNITPAGSVLLEANASLLDRSHRLKNYNWEGTLDDGATYFAMPATPHCTTSIAGLTPLTTVGFRVRVVVGKQPPGPWTQTVSILVR